MTNESAAPTSIGNVGATTVVSPAGDANRRSAGAATSTLSNGVLIAQKIAVDD